MTVTRESQRESPCDFGVSHTTPTRPDPTRPLYVVLTFASCRHLRNASRRDGMMPLRAVGVIA